MGTRRRHCRMYWHVSASFERLQDPDQPAASGHTVCIRVGCVTRDALAQEDLDPFERDMLMSGAVIGPQAFELWPERAVASVLCSLAVFGPDPVPVFDTDLVVEWLVARMDQVDGIDPPVFTSGDIMTTSIKASGAWEESGEVLTSVSVTQIDNVVRIVNLRAYILGGNS